MFNEFVNFQGVGVRQFDEAATSAIVTGRGLQAIACEAADYSKKTVEAHCSYVELQTSLARASLEDFLALLARMNKLYSEILAEAFQGSSQAGLKERFEEARNAQSDARLKELGTGAGALGSDSRGSRPSGKVIGY